MTKRTADSESKFIRELRKENQRLKSENRQLRKENRRLNDRAPDDPFEEETEAQVFVPVEPQEEKFSCPKCGAYLKNTFEIVGKRYYRCDCGSKGPISKAKSESGR